MPDIAQVLKAEIQRIARKELRVQMAALQHQVSGLKQTVRQQRERIAELERTTSRLARAAKSEPVQETPTTRHRRLSPTAIRRHRERLRLSQRQLGEFLGVTAITIGRWEKGESVPREQQRRQIAQLRKEGIRSVREKLGG